MTAKKTAMMLYSDASDVYSHRVRIVLAEKGVNVDILHVDPVDLPQSLLDANPYSTIPTLVDRELTLYEPGIIMEYLDERFPHPPLLPVYPIARAKCRLMMHRIEKDWFTLLNTIKQGNKSAADKARKILQERLISVSPVFDKSSYFLNDEFSLVDCYIAPLLLRLPKHGIHLANISESIKAYTKRIFSRPSFQASLSDIERELIEEYDFE